MASPDDDVLSVASTERPTVQATRPKSASLSVARYARRSLLGRGGLGEVWLAHDRMLDRYVAVKIVAASASAESRERFEHEARLQAALEHPGIAPVYDIGVEEDGRPFFVMQHIAGEPLSEILKRRVREPEMRAAWPVGRLLRLFIETCRSVEYAQTRNVVHCDLKPENIIVGKLGEPYVIDWGISRRMQRRGDEANNDAVLGSPGYMAPEQLEGRWLVSARTDVYSLGCILFEMLAGKPIVNTQDGVAWAVRVLNGLDARASRHVGASIVPPELDAICVRATAVDPEARYASVGELAHDVEAFENGDRDAALRKSLGAAARETARERVEAFSHDASTLGLAMRGAARALALDPEDDEARELVQRIFATNPKVLPEDFVALRAEDDARRVHEYAKSLRIAYASMLVLLIAGTLFGVAPYTLLAFPLFGISLQLFQALVVVRAKSLSALRFFAWSFGDVALLLYTAAFIGPFFAMPAVMILHVMLAMHLPSASQRNAVFAAHAFGFGIPTVLELAGVTNFITVTAKGIVTHVVHVPTPARGVVLHMLVLFGFSVLAAAILVTRSLAASRAKVYAKLYWQRWLLGRLVARETPSSISRDD